MATPSAVGPSWLWGVNSAAALYLLLGYLYPYPAVLAVASSLLFSALAWPVLRWPLPANLVTATRVLITLCGLILLSLSTITPIAFAVLMILALALDGLDGWLARLTGPTPYGALFDMECDNAWLAALWLAIAYEGGPLAPLGLIIPCYRIGLVALRAIWPLVPAPPSRPLLGMPMGKVLFVAVAVLSLVTYGLSAFNQLTITSIPLSVSAAEKATTLMAVACSTYSFWPEYKAFFASNRG